MKTLAFLLAFLALAARPLPAQDRLPFWFEYQVSATYPEALQLLFEAGFAPAGSMHAAMTDRLPVGDLSARYDSILVSATQPGSVPAARYAYTYTDDFSQVRTGYERSGNQWVPNRRLVTRADSVTGGMEVTSYRASGNPSGWEIDSRLLMYRRPGHPAVLDSLTVQARSLVTGRFEPVFHLTNQYDGHTLLTGATAWILADHIMIRFQEEIRFGSNGLPAAAEVWQEVSGTRTPVARQTFEYGRGQLLSTVLFKADARGTFRRWYRMEFTDVPEGRQRSLVWLAWSEEDRAWSARQVENAEYDRSGNLTGGIRMRINEYGHRVRERFEYVYGPDGHAEEYRAFGFDQETGEWVPGKTTRFYSPEVPSSGGELADLPLAAFLHPNPSKGSVRLLLSSQTLAVFVYSASGRLVRYFRLGPGEQSVDLSDLPAGRYRVRAQQGSQYYSGRLSLI